MKTCPAARKARALSQKLRRVLTVSGGTAARLRLLFVGVVVLTMAACKAEQEYDMSNPVGFTFKTDLHATSLIARMIENSNTFLIIDAERNKGVVTLKITSNHGEKETITLSTDRENYSVVAMGANNSIVVGCIFGYSLDQTDNLFTYVAYDRQCPACLDQYTGTDFPLSFAAGGLKMECAKCGRTYSLISGGNSEDGHRMKTYHARYNKGAQTFSVTNQ